jgi:uracil-DNA glycosylase
MIVSESWDKILQRQFSEPYIMQIQTYLKRDAAVLCPKPADIWNAFKATPFEQVKVVILGQSPYHDDSAHGLAFSSIQKVTPSLQVIFRELSREFGHKRENPNLTDWAEQGVLLLNSALTTTRGDASAHSGIGWEKLTGYVLSLLARRKSPTVFMLWGKDAKAVGERSILPNMHGSEHLILKAIHPQAENYGDGTYTFTGCGHFRKANDFLGEHKRGRIKWV